MIKDIIEDDVIEKRWGMTLSSLSHTPMSKEAGKDMAGRFKELDRKLMALLRSVGISENPVAKQPIDSLKSTVVVHSSPGEDLGDLVAGIKKS